MDTVYELLVARQNKPINNFIKAGLITFLAVTCLFALLFFPQFAVVPVALAALAWFFVFPRFNVEYEYTLLSQDLDVDIIYSKAKRKSIATYDLREAEIIAPATSSRLDVFRATKILDYSTQNPSDTPYAILIPLNGDLNKILIQPDTKMIEHLRSVAPRVTFMD